MSFGTLRTSNSTPRSRHFFKCCKSSLSIDKTLLIIVLPIQKLIEVSKDPRFGETHALILFETPQDALRAIEGGVPIKTLNVGSMAHSTGKTMINNVLSMDKEDVATFEKMRDLGVEFDVRKVPNDTKKDLFDLIKKANVQ